MSGSQCRENVGGTGDTVESLERESLGELFEFDMDVPPPVEAAEAPVAHGVTEAPLVKKRRHKKKRTESPDKLVSKRGARFDVSL